MGEGEMMATGAAKALAEVVGLLGEVKSTTDMLYQTLIAFRERGADAETDEAFEMVCEILRLMGEGVPVRLAHIAMDLGVSGQQNAPGTGTVQ